mmetsp:Transcript_30441/g.54527  ORF Transcript_30441/g.54527 Transcript_30441/m.54527 type:complete len:288 (+) Transcript_30441:602-1465(+)
MVVVVVAVIVVRVVVVVVGRVLAVMLMAIIMVVVVVAVVIILLQVQKIGVLLQHLFEVKRFDPQHLGELHLRVLGFNYVRDLVDALNAFPDILLLLLVDKVNLVEQNPIRERNLLNRLINNAGFLLLIQVLHDVLRVHDGEDGVQAHALLDLVVHKEGLCDRGGISQAGGLHQNGVQLLLALHQLGEDADEITAHCAAHTAIVHLKDFLLCLHNQGVIDAHLAILVLDNRDLQAVVGFEDVVNKGCLPAAKKARHHRDRNFFIHGSHLHFNLDSDDPRCKRRVAEWG